jgi:tetratricopeptide (TPR) repeat protein
MEVRVKPVALCTWIAILLVLLVAVPANGVGQQPSIDEQRQTAIALEQQGRNAEAENAWRAVMQAQPSSAEAYAHLGFLEARQERYRQAIPLYRKALAVDPRMPGLEMNLGLALFKAGDLKAAVTIFNKLLKAEAPSRAESRRLKTLIGMAEYGLQDYSAAIPYLKEATTEDPQNLPFRLVLAHSCFAAKQYQCVLDVYREILNLNAESAEADMLAGEALDEMQDHAGAIQQFRAAVKANPKEPNVHFGLGYLLWTQGQYAEAADQFQAELTNVPDHAQALVYLADSNIKLSHINEAQRLLQKAVRIKPDLEMAHLDLGVVYADSGRQAEALRELKFAAKMNPEDVAVHWRLAQLYRSMGRRREAEAEFEKTKTLSKAADESVSSKLNSAHSQTEGAATGVPAAN